MKDGNRRMGTEQSRKCPGSLLLWRVEAMNPAFKGNMKMESEISFESVQEFVEKMKQILSGKLQLVCVE